MCPSLTNVTIADNVTSIGERAFDSCASLINLTIGNGVTTIEDNSFSESGLTSVTIPSSVTRIGSYVFYNCPGLVAINVDGRNLFYSDVDGVLLNKPQTLLIQYPPGKIGTSFAIPNSVTSIGSFAFAFCSSLTNVTMSSSLTNIGPAAFSDCRSLNSVTIPASVISIGRYAFTRCDSLTGAYFLGNWPNVDQSAFLFSTPTLYYLPGTTGWGPTFAGRPTALWSLPNPVILKSSNFGVQTNGFGFIISWATNLSVVVEACTDLVDLAWSPVGTNTLAGGSSYFSDPQWTNHPNRFYRLRSP